MFRLPTTTTCAATRLSAYTERTMPPSIEATVPVW
jgi:hypothetical protein